MKKLRENKVYKIIKTIFNAIVFTMCFLFLVVVCLQRFSNNKISLFNYRMFTVASGSMEPEYNIGDVLIAKKKDADKIKVGDTISYLGEKGGFKDKVITHRVESIEQDESGNYIYHTKGLVNIVEDPTVYYSQVYGVIVYKTVVLSFIYRLIASKYGLFIFIILPLFYIIGSEMVSFLLNKEEKRRKIG